MKLVLKILNFSQEFKKKSLISENTNMFFLQEFYLYWIVNLHCKIRTQC